MVTGAVTSDGALPILRRAATRLAPGVPVLSVSKGLAQSRGRAVTLSDAIAELTGLHIVTAGGPSKALELARRVPTAVVYASPQAAVRRRGKEAPPAGPFPAAGAPRPPGPAPPPSARSAGAPAWSEGCPRPAGGGKGREGDAGARHLCQVRASR